MSVLVVAEHLQGRVRDITYELVTAARALGGPVAVAAIGSDPASLDVNRVGVDEVVHVRVEQEEFENDVYQAALERLLAERRPDVVLLGFTVNSMGYAGAVAAKLGLGFASDVFAVSRDGDAVVATRAFHGSKTSPCSPGRAASSMTSQCPACCMRRSCAARTRTLRSAPSMPRMRWRLRACIAL